MANYSPTPPLWADRLLRWLCPPYLLEELLGDLHEQFADQVEDVGEQKARQLYILEVIKFVKPYFLKRRAATFINDTTTTIKTAGSIHKQPVQPLRRVGYGDYPQPFLLNPSMLRNYLKIAFRNLWKSKGYAAINVVGLSVAFFVSVFLFLTAYFQLSYDSFHKDGDRVFQTYLFSNDPEKASRSGGMPFPLTPAIKAEYPEVEAATRLMNGSNVVTYKGKSLDKNVMLTDPDFLKIFSFPMIKGNRATALNDQSSIVISQTMAKAIFGDEDPIGKQLQLGREENKKDFIVTGVLGDAPDNSSIRYDAFIQITNFSNYQSDKDKWDAMSHSAYLKLAPNVDQATFETRLKSFANKYFSDNLEKLKKQGAKPDERGDLFAVRLQKLSDVHFGTDISGGKGSPITVVYALSGIGLFYPTYCLYKLH